MQIIFFGLRVSQQSIQISKNLLYLLFQILIYFPWEFVCAILYNFLALNYCFLVLFNIAKLKAR